jgi:hypothetical protein
VDISEQDILAAMKHIQGYIDISPGDFKEVFKVAYSPDRGDRRRERAQVGVFLCRDACGPGGRHHAHCRPYRQQYPKDSEISRILVLKIA